MKKIVFTADELRALNNAADDPYALDDEDYEAKFATKPGTREHERMVAAYRTAINKLRQANRRPAESMKKERSK